MKEAAAGLVVLEIVRTKLKDGVINLTEDELHAALMEAIDLATGGPVSCTDFPTPVQRGGQGDDHQPRVES